jgi:hypothetical protein
MKLGHIFGLVGVLGALAASGAVAACSSDTNGSGSGNGADSGAQADTGGGHVGDSGGGISDSGGGISDSGGGSKDAGGSSGDGGTPAVSCDTYCTQIVATCTGANKEYNDKATCLAVCAKMAPGVYAGAGDTLGCRQYHADNAAKGNPTLHCKHAGPLGAGVCSDSNCEAFCALDIANCGSGASAPYTDQASCVQACAAFAYNGPSGDVALTSGNSLNCRTYHLEVAYGGDAAAGVHCPHTAQNGGGVGGPCTGDAGF